MVCVNDALFILDRRSNVVFEHRAKVHHDVAPLADGELLVPDKAIHFYRSRMVYFDGLAWLDRDGKVKRRWSTWDARDQLQKLHPPSPLDDSGKLTKLLARSYDYYHLNTVESLPATALGERDPRFRAGNLLLCLRNPGAAAHPRSRHARRGVELGPGVLDGPHMPTLLENGHILVFDNGTDRDHSRILELDPVTLEIAWEYRADPPAEVPLQVARVERATAQRQHPHLRERPRARVRGHAGGRDGLGVLESGAARGAPARDLPLRAASTRRGWRGRSTGSREKVSDR